MLSKAEELKLLALCSIRDDRVAFGKLVEAYQTEVRQFLLNLTLGDAALSDDLAQDTFLKAYINVRSFRGLSKFSTWLYRIAYNEFCIYCRRSHEERMPENSETNIASDDGEYYDGGGEASYDSSGGVDARMDVEQCLMLLTETERSVVTLFYLHDCTIKKISDIMQMPEGTVKSHLSRSKGKLSKLLKR